MTHSVSVIIPTYNRAYALPRALASVLEQTHPADEVIVVDDGSTDETAEMLNKSYPQIKLIQQNNQGVSAARNTGIKASSSEWIALLDSDDEWLPQKLEKQFQLLTTEPDIKLIHSDEVWIRNGVRVNQMDKHAKYGGWIFEHCLPLCAISPSAALIRRELFDELGLFDETLPACEDYDLWLRITSRYPVLYCEEPLITKFGGHQDQLSRKHWGMDRFRIMALDRILDQGGLNPAQQQQALKTILKKLTILLNGAQKRNNRPVLRDFTPLLEKWQNKS